MAKLERSSQCKNSDVSLKKSVSFKQRRCDRCKNFIQKVKYDPHFLCVSCRGGRCEFGKKSCDFCISWSKDKWESLVACPRTYNDKKSMQEDKLSVDFIVSKRSHTNNSSPEEFLGFSPETSPIASTTVECLSASVKPKPRPKQVSIADFCRSLIPEKPNPSLEEFRPDISGSSLKVEVKVGDSVSSSIGRPRPRPGRVGVSEEARTTPGLVGLVDENRPSPGFSMDEEVRPRPTPGPWLWNE